MTTRTPAGKPEGLTANSFAALSLEPPLVLWSVGRLSPSAAAFVASGHFAINYLSKDAGAVYQRFSAWDAPKGAERFAGLDYVAGKSGAPIFTETTGSLECEVEEIVERHGTALVIGRILRANDNEGTEPLVHYRGKILG